MSTLCTGMFFMIFQQTVLNSLRETYQQKTQFSAYTPWWRMGAWWVVFKIEELRVAVTQELYFVYCIDELNSKLIYVRPPTLNICNLTVKERNERVHEENNRRKFSFGFPLPPTLPKIYNSHDPLPLSPFFSFSLFLSIFFPLLPTLPFLLFFHFYFLLFVLGTVKWSMFRHLRR